MTGGKFANGAAGSAFGMVVQSVGAEMKKSYYAKNPYPNESYTDFIGLLVGRFWPMRMLVDILLRIKTH